MGKCPERHTGVLLSSDLRWEGEPAAGLLGDERRWPGELERMSLQKLVTCSKSCDA